MKLLISQDEATTAIAGWLRTSRGIVVNAGAVLPVISADDAFIKGAVMTACFSVDWDPHDAPAMPPDPKTKEPDVSAGVGCNASPREVARDAIGAVGIVRLLSAMATQFRENHTNTTAPDTVARWIKTGKILQEAADAVDAVFRAT